MNLIDAFKPPFTLVSSSSRDLSDEIPNVKFEFKTEDIWDSTTREEVFIISKMYLDNIITQYKHYILNGERITESTYKLYVAIWEDEDGEWDYKHIYSIFYSAEEDRITWESKYDTNTTIEGKFYIGIDVIVYVFQEIDAEADAAEADEEYKLQQAISEDECVICYENKANVLYTKCLHYAVCDSCDKTGKFSKGPLCRKKIKNQRIKIYTQNVYIMLFVILVTKLANFLNVPYAERKLKTKEFKFKNQRILFVTTTYPIKKIFSSLLLRKIFYNIL